MRRHLIAVACAALALSGCGDLGASDAVDVVDSERTGPIPIVEVIEEVEYYIGCANFSVTIGDDVWYPVARGLMSDEVERIESVPRELRAAPTGFAPRVAPPGPGDDIGTLWVYEDGVAFYRSDSGLTVWLTLAEQTYDWEC